MSSYADFVAERRAWLLLVVAIPTLAAALGLARFDPHEDSPNFQVKRPRSRDGRLEAVGQDFERFSAAFWGAKIVCPVPLANFA